MRTHRLPEVPGPQSDRTRAADRWGAVAVWCPTGSTAGPTSNSCWPVCSADLGVRTFGDLRTGEEPEQFAWSLVVTASDLSRRRLVRIPWDLDSYGIDPDDFPVARAVHASSAIPYVFEPVRVGGATWVDGGLLSEFPGGAVRPAGAEPRWPTFGIRLSARPGIPPTHPVHGPVSLGIAAIETLVSNQDNAYIDDPCTVRRTIFVPADEVSPIDFNITAEQRDALYQRGLQAGQQFLQTWNYADYLAPAAARRKARLSRVKSSGAAYPRAQPISSRRCSTRSTSSGKGNCVGDTGDLHTDINGVDRPDIGAS